MDELKLYQICALEEFDNGHSYIRNYCLFAKSKEDAKENFNHFVEKRLKRNMSHAHIFSKTTIDSIKEVKPKAGIVLMGQMELWE